MNLYQKRKDIPLAVLLAIACYVLYPFALLVLLLKEAYETARDDLRTVDSPRTTYRYILSEMRYRRAARQAKRNNPKLDWD